MFTVNRHSASQRATELKETQYVAESLIAAENANEEELALLEEDMDGLGASSSVSQTRSWRSSACFGNLIQQPGKLSLIWP
jgi:hypothetical protein